MKTLFLSFSSNDVPVVDLIEQKIKGVLGNQIIISRYERKVGYRDSFKQFMESLSNHDYVLSVVSDSYLKSFACLYEVGEALKNKDYEKKLFFVVLSKEDEMYYPRDRTFDVAADIYIRANRIKYLEYWNKKNENDRIQLDKLDTIIARKEWDEYSQQLKISQFDLPVFLDYIHDSNGISLSELIKDDFLEITEEMFPNFIVEYTKYSDIKGVLEDYIYNISQITKTDYNQIVLKGKTSLHSSGYIVVASKIAYPKQNYRIVINGGYISTSIDQNKVIVASDTTNDENYFQAVYETKSEIVIPIRLDGCVLGAINSESESKNYFTDEIINQLLDVADKLGTLLSHVGYKTEMSEKQLPFIYK